MTRSDQISSGSLLGNTLLNFLGFAIPLIFSVVTIPFIVHRLGPASFGVLSLAWAVLGYFTLLDFGIGRAATRAVAESVEKDDPTLLSEVVWTSVTIQAVAGILEGLVLVLVAPLLVALLRAPPGILAETRLSFFLIGLSLPFAVVSSAFRGVLEGMQRFDLVNTVKIPAGIAGSAAPLVGVLLGWHLPGIIALQIWASSLVSLTYAFLALFALPVLRQHFLRVRRTSARSLVSYGGWMTLAGVFSPLLVYIDRFVLGAVRSVSEVAFYSAPYSLVSKLWILPGSMFVTVFPSFSAIGLERKENLEALFRRTSRYVFLATATLVLMLVLLSESLLRFWLGAEFAVMSTRSLQILAVGFLLNSLAWVPSTLLQAVGRPDVVAKLFSAEVIPYGVIMWWLVTRLGIIGAALSWAVRGLLEFALFSGASRRVAGLRIDSFANSGTIAGVACLVILAAVGLLINAHVGRAQPVQVLAVTGIVCLFLALGWRFVLNDFDRQELGAALMHFAKRMGVGQQT